LLLAGFKFVYADQLTLLVKGLNRIGAPDSNVSNMPIRLQESMSAQVSNRIGSGFQVSDNERAEYIALIAGSKLESGEEQDPSK
jgi:hypothetical protein